jgi:hypothetical protein
MPTSGSTNYSTTRDLIITRALRIVNELGTGETASATRLTECAQALNDIFKEFQADGMHVWKIATSSAITLTANVGSYSIGTGATINQVAPLKIYQAYVRNTTTNTDTDVAIWTKQEYDAYSTKTQQGQVTQLYYAPPGNLGASEQRGTIYVLERPDTAFAAGNQLYVTGQYPFEDFDAASDIPDCPSYYYNALVWALADQLSWEAGTPPGDRDRIGKKAREHREMAKSFDIEEGSLYIQPNWQGQV